MTYRVVSEAYIKQRIRALLDGHGERVYYEMHVPYGYGKPGIDFNVSVAGRALYIEAKRPGKYPTYQQRLTLLAAHASGGACFIVSTGEGLEALARWIDRQLENPRG